MAGCQTVSSSDAARFRAHGTATVGPPDEPTCLEIRVRGEGAEDGADMTGRYLEDFAVGQTFGSGRMAIDEAQINGEAVLVMVANLLVPHRRQGS